MNLTLEVESFGGCSAFKLTPIDRWSRGERIKRLPTDVNGSICHRARITHDGIPLPNGTTNASYEDVHGNTVNRRHLVTLDVKGQLLRTSTATSGRVQTLQPVDAKTLLSVTIHKAYYLEAITLHPILAQSLRDGALYQVPFRPRASTHQNPTFLLGNDLGFFLIQGRPIEVEMMTAAEMYSAEDMPSEETPWDWDHLWESDS
jgi:hypothetical protein